MCKVTLMSNMYVKGAMYYIETVVSRNKIELCTCNCQ